MYGVSAGDQTGGDGRRQSRDPRFRPMPRTRKIRGP